MSDMLTKMLMLVVGLISLLVLAGGSSAQDSPRRSSGNPVTTQSSGRGALFGQRHRVLVSTDIGGTDPDDFQSLVHLLVYADLIDLEGIISSPYGPGRKQHILDVIDCYEKDYSNLRKWSDRYPSPDALRAISIQGETEVAPYTGVRNSTEGSKWIIQCARRVDTRPLFLLVWGGIEDLAQALHDAPDITEKLRVYFIGGPNKKWSVNAYKYIADNHPTLWMIEANSTYRGWFVGGDQSGQWGNQAIVREHIAGHGALGQLFNDKLANLKMGDTPSVGWLLNGDPSDPTCEGWGGQFVRAWERPYQIFNRLTDHQDKIEAFGIAEFALPLGDHAPAEPAAEMMIENQSLAGVAPGDGTIRFRFCPKGAKSFDYQIRANVPSLDTKTGSITAVLPGEHLVSRPSDRYPNWWTDDPAPAQAEGEHQGARTISRWRTAFLKDFAERMDRCRTP